MRPATGRRNRSLALVVGCLAALAGACGDDDDSRSELPLVGDIAPAIAALEEELSQPQQYYEIHTTSLSVTLWVSADEGHRAIPYVYAEGELADPEASQEGASGFTFAAADALVFDPDTIFDQVEAELDGSAITEFSIVGGAGGAVRLGIVTQSERGGQLDIRLDPEGSVIEAAPLD